MNPDSKRVYADGAVLFYVSSPHSIVLKAKIVAYTEKFDRYCVDILGGISGVWVNSACLSTHNPRVKTVDDNTISQRTTKMVGAIVKACWGNKLTGKVTGTSRDGAGNLQFTILWENGQTGTNIPRGNINVLHTPDEVEENIATTFVKGDIVQSNISKLLGVVDDAQPNQWGTVGVRWGDTKFRALTYEATSDVIFIGHAESLIVNGSIAPSIVTGFQKGDRVKFRHNGKCGKVILAVFDNVMSVEYDDGTYANEDVKNLVLLHSPSAAAKAKETPHKFQVALDIIEEERRLLKLRVEADQRRLGELSKAKELLLREV